MGKPASTKSIFWRTSTAVVVVLTAGLFAACQPGQNCGVAPFSPGASLAGTDQRGVQIQFCNLDGIDLAGADLRGANLVGTSLRGADLSQADLRGVNLTWANLTDANLSGADLYEARLENVAVANASFAGASLDATTTKGVAGVPASLPANWVLVEGALTATAITHPDHDPLFIDDPRYYGSGPKVAVLGDSITVASHEEMQEDFVGRATRIIALFGEGFAGGPWSEVFQLPTPLAIDRAGQIGSTGAQVAVIALGTNDAWWPALASRDTYAAMESVYSSVDDACTVGVLITETAPDSAYDVGKAEWINDQTRSRADVIVDWRLNPQPGAIAADGIHLTESGAIAYAAAVSGGVDSCLASP